MQDPGYGLPRIPLPRLSEKPESRLRSSPAAAGESLFRRFCRHTEAKSTLAASLDRLQDGFECQLLGRSVNSEKKPPLAAVRNET